MKFIVTYEVFAGQTTGQTFTYTASTRKRKAPADDEVYMVRDLAVIDGRIPPISDPCSRGIRKIQLSRGKDAISDFDIIHDTDEACTPLYRETVTMVRKA